MRLRSISRTAVAVGLSALALGPAAIVTAAPDPWTLEGGVPAQAGQALADVAMRTDSDGWAVGSRNPEQTRTLMLRWNGAGWAQETVPAPGNGPSFLSGVDVHSADLAWAVGAYGSRAKPKALILRWNGSEWSKVPSPAPGRASTLNAVEVVSATRAWAVGWFRDRRNFEHPLMLRWDGQAWSKVALPAMPASRPGFASGGNLRDIAATSGSRAWAVGNYEQNYTIKPLVLRWNGRKWSRVKADALALGGELTGVAASSASNVWVVGHKGWEARTLAARWNGSSWRRVATPNPGNRGAFTRSLEAVAAPSGDDARAVGWYEDGVDDDIKTLVLQWEAGSWKVADSPSPFVVSLLHGIDAISSSLLWAVGETNQALVIRCC
jgi:hypothetical protein